MAVADDALGKLLAPRKGKVAEAKPYANALKLPPAKRRAVF